MNKISDLSRTNFTIMPNVVDDMLLPPLAFRLYMHIKRRAGESGVCWESTRNMAEACCMALGSVTNAKEILVQAGLIKIETKQTEENHYHEITVVDIWGVNYEHFKEGSRSPGEQARSCGEQARSCGERNNIPINKNPINNNCPSDFPEVPEDFDPLNDPLPEVERPATPFNLLLTWWESKFGYTRPADITALQEMSKEGATPETMEQAAKVLVSPKYRVTSAGSFRSTVTNILNKQKLEEVVKTPTIEQYHPSRIIT